MHVKHKLRFIQHTSHGENCNIGRNIFEVQYIHNLIAGITTSAQPTGS
jgi:hypothetical protein